MLNKKDKKAEQLLQLDVDSLGEEDYLQQQQEAQYQQQEQQGQAGDDHSGNDDNSNSRYHSSDYGLDSNASNNCQDDAQSLSNSSSQNQSLSHHENYSQQSSSFHHQQTHSRFIQSRSFPTTEQQSANYKSIFNEQQYLIVDNQNLHNNSLSSHPPRTTNKGASGQLTQENDTEVDKIIQQVLFKRKHKQKQKQLIQNIINSERNHNFVNQLNNKDQMTTKFQFIDPTFRKQKKQKNGLKSYEEMIKKCKQLEIKINKMTKKRLERQKIQQNKQSLKQKKQNLMSKRELSLEKLKKRLQKALSLNLSLAKRVKLQKSQLASIRIMRNHSSQVQQPTINQESTIKGMQSVNLMRKNGQKYYVEDTCRSCSKSVYEQLSRVGVSREKGKGVQKSQKGKQKRSVAANKCLKELTKNKTSSSVQQQISPFSPSPAIYKSPILQFNSYLIDESQYKSPSINKENIYIQDDMNSLPKQQDQRSLSHSKGQNKWQNQSLLDQLKQWMGEYLALEMKEKSLQQRMESNSMKIKKYENEHYHKIVEV